MFLLAYVFLSRIKTVGYIGLFLMVFAESGLLVGFFFPGDSLLFTAGFLASQGLLRIGIVALLSFAAAVLGDSVGYAFGAKIGPRIFTKEDSFFFHKEYIVRARTFFENHGPKTIILARFLPVVRTFAPMVAGVGHMRYRTFLKYNIIGAVLWAIGLTLLGYFLGSVIPNVDQYIIPIVVSIVVLSGIPTLFHLLKARQSKK